MGRPKALPVGNLPRPTPRVGCGGKTRPGRRLPEVTSHARGGRSMAPPTRSRPLGSPECTSGLGPSRQPRFSLPRGAPSRSSPPPPPPLKEASALSSSQRGRHVVAPRPLPSPQRPRSLPVTVRFASLSPQAGCESPLQSLGASSPGGVGGRNKRRSFDYWELSGPAATTTTP